MKRSICFAIALGLVMNVHAASTPTPDQALQMLTEGNNSFVNGTSKHVAYLAEAKDKLLEKQTPFAAIVGCSDSRVPPELIFDRGLGELFVIRDAGNVIGPIEQDSVDFAVAGLNVPLVVVLGHQNCGAVKATLDGNGSNVQLGSIVPLIESAFQNCPSMGNRSLVNAIYCNVKQAVATLKQAAPIAMLVQQNKVKVVGAYYEIASGKVIWITD